jgi:YesN/AraC family two-component response regulator
MLKNSGYFVQQAGDGDQALEICCEFDPDIVITDIIMPNKEGLETIQDLMA